MAGKYLSTPPASQSPGMAIQKNPYASDEAGGYNMFSGDYEVSDKGDLWDKLLKALRAFGEKPSSQEEFDSYYDTLQQGAPNLSSENTRGGNSLFPKEEATPTYQDQSSANWKRILDSIQSSAPASTPDPMRPSVEDSASIPEPDMMDKPLTADYATREEFEKALREWEINQGYLD